MAPAAAMWRLTVGHLRLRRIRLKQEAGEVVRREEGAVRTLCLAQQGLPAQEVAVTQQHRRCGPRKKLAHGRSRVSIVHQVTANE